MVLGGGGGELESTPLKSSDKEASSSLELKLTLDFFCFKVNNKITNNNKNNNSCKVKKKILKLYYYLRT